MANVPFVVQDAGTDRVEQQTWVPKGWTARDLTPGSLRSLGLALSLIATHLGTRDRRRQFIVSGLGACIGVSRFVHVKCSCVVAAADMHRWYDVLVSRLHRMRNVLTSCMDRA